MTSSSNRNPTRQAHKIEISPALGKRFAFPRARTLGQYIMISKILVTLLASLVARGVIMAFGLDAKAARLIRTARSSKAAIWIISGCFGLVCVLAWQLFDVDEVLSGLRTPSPELGSFAYSRLQIKAGHHPGSAKSNYEIVVILNNLNDYAIGFRAKINADVNGVMMKNDGPLELSGVVAAKDSRWIVYRVRDVPTTRQPGSNESEVVGWAEYDISYFVAPQGKKSRRTAKRVNFDTHSVVPAGGSVEERIETTTIFSNEVEE